jgi:ubiquinone/menaquinone biosynthesis C-methylase UbiE
MNVEVNYPLGHSITEMGRLDLQSKLFEDPLLLELAHTAGTCLEIGAGTGANLSGLRKANQIIQYHGVDLSSTAIEVAKRTYGSEFTTFAVGDATKLNEANNSFDLVFSKLVLWSMGKHWKNAIIEAHRVLKSGDVSRISQLGGLYAFDLCESEESRWNFRDPFGRKKLQAS